MRPQLSVSFLILASLALIHPGELTSAPTPPDVPRAFTIDGGGGASASGSLRLRSVIGQAIAGVSSAGDLRQAQGFLATVRKSQPLFQDDFESGDFNRWSLAVGAAAP